MRDVLHNLLTRLAVWAVPAREGDPTPVIRRGPARDWTLLQCGADCGPVTGITAHDLTIGQALTSGRGAAIPVTCVCPRCGATVIAVVSRADARGLFRAGARPAQPGTLADALSAWLPTEHGDDGRQGVPA